MISKAGILAVLLALTCVTSAQPASLTDTLKAHLNAFISANYPGEMTYTVTDYETISGTSDLDALADLMTLNWHVIDTGASKFVAITGPASSRQSYAEAYLKPKMTTGALVARIDWAWGSETATEYAIVTPDATAGDVTKILEGIVGWFRPVGPAPAASSVEYNYNNGFGMHVAHFEASIGCEGGVCIPHVSAWASLPGDNVDYKKKVWCENNMCIMDVAFVGYTGWPDVEFEAKDYKFKVSGWGWQWHTSFDRLTTPCPCTPSAEPVACNTIGDALALVDDTRVWLTDKAVTRSRNDLEVAWLEETDRSAGVRVSADSLLHQGQLVTLSGTLSTEAATRHLAIDDLTPEEQTAQVRPLFMNQETIGGGDRNQYTPGITGAAGLNNVGMLVTTCGRVTNIGPDFFYIEDGSKLHDGTGNQGLRVFSQNLPPVFPGQYLLVTGLVNASIYVPNNTRIRLLIPGGQQDIWPLLPFNPASQTASSAPLSSIDYIR